MDVLPMSMDRDSLQQLLGEVDTVLFDCDGVLWVGDEPRHPVPGAPETVAKLQAMGKKVLLLTNNSTLTTEHLVNKSNALGFNVQKDHVITVSLVIAQYLKQINFRKKVYVLGSAAMAQELQKAGIRCIGIGPERIGGSLSSAVANNNLGLDPEVGAVAVGADREFNYDKLVRASAYLSKPDCVFLAAHKEYKYLVTSDKDYLPGCGLLVEAVEKASGREVQIVGKPSSTVLQLLQTRYGVHPQRTLIIGDTLKSDIQFGNESGMWSVLVLSGVSTLQEARNLSLAQDQRLQKQVPLFYLDSVADIMTLLDSQPANSVNESQH